MKKKLAVVATHPVQYHAPVWRGLAQIPELDTHVFFGSDFSVQGYRDPQFGVQVQWDLPLVDGYAHTFLTTGLNSGGQRGFFDLRPRDLRPCLRKFKPDCVLILGYMPFFWWETAFVARSLGIPILVRSEATDVAISRSLLKGWLRRAFLKTFYSQCAGFLAIGHNAYQHYLNCGITREQIGWSPYCVEVFNPQNQTSQGLPTRESIRRELGFSDKDLVFIFSAKLTSQKDPMTLARAFQALSDTQRETLDLIVMGDGVLREQMEREYKRTLGNRVAFVGFVNQSQIGRYYSAADCLVLPSLGETWGLVVNEGLHFGLPAIVSDRVGCHPDLIVEGETGYVFPVGDAQLLGARMLDVVNLLRERHDFVVARCHDKVSQYSVEQAVKGIVQATRRCTSSEF